MASSNLLRRTLTVVEIAFILAMAAQAAAWLFDRSPAMIYHRAVVEQPVKRGEQIVATFEREIFRQCEIRFVRSLTDENGRAFVLSSDSALGRPPGVDLVKYGSRAPAPTEAACGRGVYTVHVASICNPLHHLWPVIGQPAAMPVDIECD